MLARYYKFVAGQDGASLVEVLAAVAILTAVMLPMLTFSPLIGATSPYQRQIAVTLAASKVEELAKDAYRTNSGTWPGSSGSDSYGVGAYNYARSWTVQNYAPSSGGCGGACPENTLLKKAVVTVTCDNCPSTMPAVKVVAILEKVTCQGGLCS